MELSKHNLAFIDVTQALKIHPNNGELEQKFNEVTSLLGLSSSFVETTIQVVGEDKAFRNSSLLG